MTELFFKFWDRESLEWKNYKLAEVCILNCPAEFPQSQDKGVRLLKDFL